jgi:hypothetical protein
MNASEEQWLQGSDAAGGVWGDGLMVVFLVGIHWKP